MMLGTLLLLTAVFSAGDEPPEAPSAYKRWVGVYRGIAESVTMRRGDTELTFVPQPLHFYTNPVRMNDQHGAIFLWSEGGRPAVIGSIWSAMNRQNPAVRFVTHEWHSLSEDTNVSATRENVILWTSGEPGVSWSRLENASAPAGSRPQRLVQMRSLARRYAGEIEVEGESDLRLMDRPLFRYAEPVQGALDGAIFVLAMATDPELLIWLEARPSEGQSAWHVAFARFGNKAMKVKEGDRTVWSCPAGAPGYSRGKYYLHWRAEEMPADPEP